MSSLRLDALNFHRQGPKDSKVAAFERSIVPDPLGGLGPLGGENLGSVNLGTASDSDATSRPQRMTMLRATTVAEATSPRMTMQRRPA
jgi:hypothetical protein